MSDVARDRMMQLRRRYGAAARELQGPRHGLVTGAAVIVQHVAAGAAPAVAIAWIWDHSPLAACALYPIAVAWIGSRLRALGNMVHECSHRTFVRGSKANHRIGQLLCFALFEDFAAYTAEHRSHHLYLGDPVRDRDLRSRRALFDRLGAFGPAYVRSALLLLPLRGYLRPIVWSRGDSNAVRAARLGVCAAVCAFAALVAGWSSFALFFVVPYATTYQMLRFLSDAADHAGLLDAADELDRSRNHAHRCRVVNWCLFPRNDQYHLVHHLFPAVATRHLPRLHATLLGDPIYAARAHDLKGSSS